MNQKLRVSPGSPEDIGVTQLNQESLQAMVDVCQQFVSARNLKFGTHKDPSKSKTKCVLFSKKKLGVNDVKPINLDGDVLPWVDDVKHLGHILQSDNSMKTDIAQKRGAFIGKVNSLLQEFNNVSPHILIKLKGEQKKCPILYFLFHEFWSSIRKIMKNKHNLHFVHKKMLLIGFYIFEIRFI